LGEGVEQEDKQYLSRMLIRIGPYRAAPTIDLKLHPFARVKAAQLAGIGSADRVRAARGKQMQFA
jgi:hypothetical protein